MCCSSVTHINQCVKITRRYVYVHLGGYVHYNRSIRPIVLSRCNSNMKRVGKVAPKSLWLTQMT